MRRAAYAVRGMEGAAVPDCRQPLDIG